MQGGKVSGPVPRGMDSLECKIDGETIRVKYENFKQGEVEKVLKT